MSKHTISWQIGANNASLPPIALSEQADLDDKDDSRLKFYIEQYKSHGPIFRVMRPDGPVTVLAGPDANSFVTRYGTEVLSEKAFWQEFDREYAGKELSGREGDANRQRRAHLSRSYSRGRIVDRLPSLVEITTQYTHAWQQGNTIQFYPWVQVLIAEQLGQLLTHYGPGDYVDDLDTFLSTAMAATMTREQARSALQAPGYLRARQRIFELGRAVVTAHRASPPHDREPDLVDDMLISAARAGREVADEQLALGAL
ncbi:MAG TPA: hypothetical protein VGU68_00055, partial [Ktedonobacteraceae bacterium]|nr:hypothetical protein [Ktedonobacteraceae bacterium]